MQKDTIAIHAGYDKKNGNGEMAIPISQTTAYAFRDAEHAANLFALKELGPIYTITFKKFYFKIFKLQNSISAQKQNILTFFLFIPKIIRRFLSI